MNNLYNEEFNNRAFPNLNIETVIFHVLAVNSEAKIAPLQLSATAQHTIIQKPETVSQRYQAMLKPLNT